MNNQSAEVLIEINGCEFEGEVIFHYTPYEAPSFYCPGCRENFELNKLTITDGEIDYDVTWLLSESDLAEGIIEQIKGQK